MPEEVSRLLALKPGDTVIDGTIGEGGHAASLIRKIFPGGFLIGIDKDKNILDVAERTIAGQGVNFKLFCDSYADSGKIIVNLGMQKVDGILLDLGFSRWHLKKGNRGFSFLNDEVLDMRYNTDFGFPAYQWLNTASKDEIGNVLKKFGDEKEYRKIASAIVKYRERKKITITGELTAIIDKTKQHKKTKIHPATKTFQAIRIFMNDELFEIKKGLINCLRILKKNKRLVILTYHSLEDRIVKKFLLKYSGRCSCPPDFPVCRCGAGTRKPKIRILKESGIRPTSQEIQNNPSSRSAHLRGGQVIETL